MPPPTPPAFPALLPKLDSQNIVIVNVAGRTLPELAAAFSETCTSLLTAFHTPSKRGQVEGRLFHPRYEAAFDAVKVCVKQVLGEYWVELEAGTTLVIVGEHIWRKEHERQATMPEIEQAARALTDLTLAYAVDEWEQKATASIRRLKALARMLREPES
jgi:hypothetical protein